MTTDTQAPSPSPHPPLTPTTTRVIRPATCPWCRAQGRSGDVASDLEFTPGLGWLLRESCMNEENPCEYEAVI